ncbi:PAAR-like protein [Myxacorys almedinensis]|uniref:DUF4280 domain-containing protein n=1 Tax=Myxacorys almedinensis A TaxID=2690445 RepID=A0A8J7YXK3_9CYAN|nr:PAAR-like protein [Myxacorys almedinensis]NDJ16462.1 hypothetical protein [Myxacorys almedinensis A]
MPGYLMHVGATAICAHGGLAQPTQPNPRIKVMGQMIVTQPFPYAIAGCANPTPPANVGPCTTAQWVQAATRIKVMGQPVLLQDSTAVCLPTGTGLTITVTQTRVKAI